MNFDFIFPTFGCKQNRQKDEIIQIMDFESLSDVLSLIKTDLRKKYLNDIDVIQRSTAEDPESWTKLDEVSEQIETLKRLLRHTEDLLLPKNQDDNSTNHSVNLSFPTEAFFV